MAKGDKPTVGGKQEITEIMQAFHDYWGIKPTPEFRQRQYCQHLVVAYGDKVMDIVKYALDIQSDHYAPQITSPKDLWYKRTNVIAYWRKQNEQTNQNVLKV